MAAPSLSIFYAVMRIFVEAEIPMDAEIQQKELGTCFRS
jgi:hypothetical protein